MASPRKSTACTPAIEPVTDPAALFNPLPVELPIKSLLNGKKFPFIFHVHLDVTSNTFTVKVMLGIQEKEFILQSIMLTSWELGYDHISETYKIEYVKNGDRDWYIGEQVMYRACSFMMQLQSRIISAQRAIRHELKESRDMYYKPSKYRCAREEDDIFGEE